MWRRKLRMKVYDAPPAKTGFIHLPRPNTLGGGASLKTVLASSKRRKVKVTLPRVNLPEVTEEA
jgi:hypothetical protein